MSRKEKKTLLTNVKDARPNTTTPKTPTRKPLKSSKGKRKKLSKKEILRRKREKAEQERLEQLRIAKELEEKRAHEQEQEMERLEQERLHSENEYLIELHNRKNQFCSDTRLKKHRVAEWEYYTECDHSTNPLDQADVNTFLSQWRENEETDMHKLFKQIETAKKLLDQLIEYRSQSSVSNDIKEYERFSQPIRDIRQLIETKINLLTQHQLLFSDKYASAKNEVLLTTESAGYSYGLWVNLTKNPRINNIDFGFSSIKIPKAVATTSIAIRMTISPFLSGFHDYTLLSSILSCEFFQLPIPPKRIGNMTLRQFSASSGLQPIPYTIRNQSEVQSPLVFTMKIQPELLPSDTSSLTVVKIDESESPITNINVDKESQTVTFSCEKTGLFALAIPRYNQFPFKFWEINSTAVDSCEIFIRTSLTEFSIIIDSDGLCSMSSPLLFNKMTAPKALEFMKRHGLNIVSPEAFTAVSGFDMTDKNSELEEVLNRGLADCASGFVIRCSKWNSHISSDRAILIAREIKEFGEPISDDEEFLANEEEEKEEEKNENEEEQQIEEKKSKWHCIHVKTKHINEIKYAEITDELDPKMLEGTRFHQHLMPMLMDIASEEVQSRVKSCSGFVNETMYYLLKKLRLFSSTE
ncbi:inner dynein arm i1 intermediate chain ic97 [Histomonas meleagridis]|uniref:inner dynein arm i1 intermediate chain ic97 n=1 Tax=Histomonas meleagridis TaxID=135588 RepID=UPI00355AAB4E|nr:inner dynein arm i1 intermediate chain ic97 [Histomonas meleagridis]KAH0797741.1 inner dynein arm i1 intermediate chain ic97 [Histomonas meleagridis]